MTAPSCKIRYVGNSELLVGTCKIEQGKGETLTMTIVEGNRDFEQGNKPCKKGA